MPEKNPTVWTPTFVKALKYTGLSNEKTSNKKGLMAYYGALIVFLTIYLAQVIKLVTSLNNLHDFIDVCRPFTFYGMAGLKLYSLKRNKQNLYALLNEIKTIEHKQANPRNYNKLHNSYNNRIQITVRRIMILYFLSGVIFVIAPFAQILFKKLNSQDFVLPHVLPIWSPYDFNVMRYVALVMFEILGAAYAVVIQISYDIISITTMIFLSGQFSILSHNLSQITDEEVPVVKNWVNDNIVHERIKKYNKHHVQLMRLVSSFSNLIQTVNSVYFAVVILALCTTAMHITSSNSLGTVDYISLIQYLFANLFQLFLYCKYGDDIMQTSDMSMSGVFASDWWKTSPKIRRELLITAIGTSMPQRINVAYISYLCLPAYLSIVQTAYRVYAVLANSQPK